MCSWDTTLTEADAEAIRTEVPEVQYVAASLRGERGIVRITPSREAELVVAGSGLVGICFVEDGCAAIATTNAVYHVAMDVEGRSLL